MKREELKEQGLNDDQIDFVMAQNGKEVNALNDKINGLTNERDGLQDQINDRDTQLSDLKKSVKDNADLKNQIKQLQDENKTASQKYKDQLAEQSKSFKIEGALRDAKAKNIKTVLPLIDTDKVTVNDDGTLNGLAEQIDNVKKDNGYLFSEEHDQPHVTLGGGFGDDEGKGKGDTLISRIAERMENTDK